MNRRSALLSAALLTISTTSGCSSSSSVPLAPLGEACGPEQGCETGLVCWLGSCREPGAIDAGGGTGGDAGGSDPDGGTTPGNDGGSATGCGACDAPPSACHAQQGQCVAGACVYDPVPGASCDDGNPCTVADKCGADGGCTGQPKVCNTPPSAVCVSGSELLTHDTTGSCQGGLCVYPEKKITCGDGGCVNNACQTDPCAAIICDAPPSACFSAPGTCAGGSCSYPYADGTSCDDGDTCTSSDACNAGVCVGAPKLCNQPPADSCQDANTAKIYQKVGTCSGGSCSYPVSYVSCSGGCSGGACNASGWTAMSSGATVELYAVWGSAASAVWAVGQSGTALYYDGAKWQARPSGTTETLYDVHGSAANNVFAITEHGEMIKYDGSAWAPFGSSFNFYTDPCLYVTGPDEMWVAGVQNNSSGFSLYRIESGNTTEIAHTNSFGISERGSCLIAYSAAAGVWAAANDTIHYTPPSTVDTPKTFARSLYAAPDGVVFWGTYSTVTRWEAGVETAGSTGISGGIWGLDGTSSTRVFGAGYASGGAAVITWDGVGWTTESIPAGTPLLWDIWAAHTGEVFAVGSKGTIITGP